MPSRNLYGAALLLAGSLGVVADVPFLTELEIFTQMAPCVTDVVSNAYAWEKDSTACGSEPTKLQSCICTNSNELKKMTSSIVSGVSYSCGPDAAEDQSSAAALVDKYCNPDKTVVFATPTTNIVGGFMSDIAAISSLAPCVQSGLSAAVGAYAGSGCPTVDNLWAPCVCSKTVVFDNIQSSLGPAVRESCSNGDDVTIASNFYSQFCDMNQGKTSFSPMPGPSGDMSYYITALSQYKSLRPCAQSGMIEAVMEQSSYLCPSGPQALASCVCLKPGVLGKASQSLTNSVKYYCDNTALSDVSSAADVLDYYCQAAQKKVVATVSESISQSKATTLASAGSSGGTGSPKNTAAPGSDGKDGDESGQNGSGSNSGGSGGLSRGAVIAIAVLASVVGIAALSLLAFFIRRRARKAKAEKTETSQNNQPPFGQAELATQSPSSEMDGKPAYAPPSVSEVAGTPRPYQQPHAELSGQQQHQQQQMYQTTSPSELSSPGYQNTYTPVSAMSPQQHGQQTSQPVYEMGSYQR